MSDDRTDTLCIMAAILESTRAGMIGSELFIPSADLALKIESDVVDALREQREQEAKESE